MRKMVVDHADADDLTQDVFIKVWKHLSTFRQDAALFTWIYRIATNECLNFLSSKRRRFLLPLTDVGAALAAQLFRLQHFDYCRYKWLVGLGLLFYAFLIGVSIENRTYALAMQAGFLAEVRRGKTQR